MKHRHPGATLACLLAAALTGCTGLHSQTSSGAEYLDRHSAALAAGQSEDSGTESQLSFAKRLREVAGNEPTLVFPARIGLARVERGRVTVLPVAELERWQALARELGDGVGSFTPITPLMAGIAAGGGRPVDCRRESCDPIADVVRLAAVAQHLDAVLIYEVSDTTSSDSNLLSVANLTIIGGFMLPTTTERNRAAVQAVLINPLTGYHYASATAWADGSTLTTTWGSDGDREALARRVQVAALDKLIPEVRERFAELDKALAAGPAAVHAGATRAAGETPPRAIGQ